MKEFISSKHSSKLSMWEYRIMASITLGDATVQTRLHQTMTMMYLAIATGNKQEKIVNYNYDLLLDFIS